MKILIIISILAVILVAGCTQQISNISLNNNAVTDFSNITKNSENYQNETITIQGQLAITIAGSYFLQDSQGYQILVYGDSLDYDKPTGTCKEPSRIYNRGDYYKATGFINKTYYTPPFSQENVVLYFFQCTEPMVKIS